MASEQEQERTRRVTALRQMMEKREIDAVLIIGGTNLSYYSGFAGAERSMARAMIYICPRDGEPALVAHIFRQHLLQAHAPVENQYFFERLMLAPIEAVSTALRDMGLEKGRLGFELGHESQIFMPYGEFDQLRQALADFDIIDVGKDLWRIRVKRSDFDIQRQQRAADVVNEIFAACWEHIETGMRQRDLSRFIQQQMLDRGVGANYAIISAGSENYDFCGAWAPDYRFKDGDMVWMDIGTQIDGYCAAYSRAGVLGGPSEAQMQTADAVSAATMRGVEIIAPGVSVGAVARECERALDAVDAPVTTNIAALGTRYGHGMGLEFIEPPHVAEYDDTVLEDGMVVAVEPGIATAYGRFHFRELVRVTPQGFSLFDGPESQLVGLPLTSEKE